MCLSDSRTADVSGQPTDEVEQMEVQNGEFLSYPSAARAQLVVLSGDLKQPVLYLQSYHIASACGDLLSDLNNTSSPSYRLEHHIVTPIGDCFKGDAEVLTRAIQKF